MPPARCRVRSLDLSYLDAHGADEEEERQEPEEEERQEPEKEDRQKPEVEEEEEALEQSPIERHSSAPSLQELLSNSTPQPSAILDFPGTNFLSDD
jgi:hypothetical protein